MFLFAAYATEVLEILHPKARWKDLGTLARTSTLIKSEKLGKERCIANGGFSVVFVVLTNPYFDRDARDQMRCHIIFPDVS
jgi:hypothetical protein